jgi:RHS repeat-associated protein
MNKIVRWKSSLAIVLVALLLVSASFATIRHGVAVASSTEETAPLVGSSNTLLPDGRLLLVGGQNDDGQVVATLSTKDPLTGAVSALGISLHFPRAAHTATVLPDGTVLVLGGVGQDGKLVSSAEVFDPVAGTVDLLSEPPPAPRAFHTATLLTDGRVLFEGGVFSNAVPAKTIELWDPRGRNTAMLSGGVACRNQKATLLPDGRVLLSGGEDENGKLLTTFQVFDPQSQTVSVIENPQSLEQSNGALTEMRASSPQDGAQNVPLDALISVRFSQPVLMSSISSATVALQGPEGSANAKIIAAEGGMLAFITPTTALSSGTSYSVKLTGAVDASNQTVAYAEFSFSTSGTGVPAPSSFGDEGWSPNSDWQTHREPSKYESLPDLQAPRGTTALAGQVLKLNGEPLEHVTLEIGNRRAQSDSTGRFLLAGIPAGHQVLIIEGSSANTPAKKYGRFEFGAEIKAGAQNKLDFKIWMTLLDMAHEVTIPSPTTKETILTTPTMPGLELRLPAGTVITDSNGKVITKITITPIPLDRPPFPLPFVQVPTYFTIQPGGAYISVHSPGPRGARLFYPNTEHRAPGVPYAFWNYNPDHNGWFVYGAGRVSKDRTQVVPDPGVLIYDFSGAMVGSGSPGPNTQNPAGDRSHDGEPVMLSSGLFVYNKTDLVLPDVIPLSLTRTYRPNDSWSRPFGIGATHPYEMFIGGDGTGFGTTAYIDLILPDGTRIHFTGVGPGPTYTTYLHSAAGTQWYGASISSAPSNPNNYSLPGAWQLQIKDGTIYSFPEAAGLVNPGCQALVGVTDRYGNQVKITRNTDANCTIAQITSPNGRYIQFQYDSSYRVKVATDNLGRQVQYSYDASGRLQTVTDANGGVWTYGYDSLNRMTTIQDPRLITYLTNVYNSAGNVYQQYLADGTSFYQFNWTPTANSQNTHFVGGGGSGAPAPYAVIAFRNCTTCNEGFPPLMAQVDVIDPRGDTRRVVFNQNGYTTSDTRAFGQPEQETTTYTYYPDNLFTTETDQLSRVTTYAYDVNANPTSITRLSGTSNAVTTTIAYDSTFSNPLTVTDPLNHTTSINYDTYGNATSITDPLGHQTTLGYNGIGLVTSVADALQNTTQFAYDFADLIGVTDPLLNATTIFHDGAGRVVTRTDPLGHTTKYQFNNLNQVTQITDPLQGVTSFSYDPNGNLHTVQDARQQGTNNKTVYTYDSFDHLQTRTDQLSRQESYVFDQLDNLTSFTDRRGKVATYRYDGINRRSFAGYGTLPGPTYESTINYNYDGGNRVSKVVDSTSGTITPVFDGLDRLTSETTPTGSVAYTYDNGSRRTSTTVSGQSSVCYTYDNANRLTGMGQGTCPVGMNTTGFTYDNVNRRSTLTLPNGVVLTYGYDHDSRINSMSYQLGTTALGSLTYTYDADGRRTQVGGSLAATGFPQAAASAAYDVANELTNWNGTTITYDANGNIQNDGVASYTWNARNQLIARGATSLQYDSYGRRTLNPAGSNLFYEGWDVAQELSGSTPVANRILGRTDEFFTRTDSTGTYSPITDALGSILALTNSSGNITTQYSYDPFGNTTTVGSPSTNVSQYTARENDGNGLYYYRARYYNPVFGRFTSEDPIGFAGGINQYAYAFASPLTYRDPSGHGSGFDWLNNPVMDFAGRYSNWLPGACEGGLFAFGGGNATNPTGTNGGFLGALQDYSYSPEQGWQLGQGAGLGEGFATAQHTPVGGGAILPSGEVIGFVAPYDAEVDGGSVEGGMFYGFNPNNPGDGISIGLFGEGTGPVRGNVGGTGGQAAAGLGAYLTFTNAATCVDRYNRAANH